MSCELVSIIVPVYNKEKYLEKCIESALMQTYKNIELILVDDSSTDNSFSLCEKYKEKDKRIKLIRIAHGGVSKARNRGLELCNGDYITFLDADDVLNMNAIDILYNGIEESNSDIFIGGIDVNQLKKYNTYSQYILQHRSCAVWGILYKKNILKDIRFCENLSNNEDIVFLFDVSKITNNVAATSTMVIQYNWKSKDSLSKSKSIEKLNSTLQACNIIESKLSKDLKVDFIVYKFYMYIYVLGALGGVSQKEQFKVIKLKEKIVRYLRKYFLIWLIDAKEKNIKIILKSFMLILLPEIAIKAVKVTKGKNSGIKN